MLLSGNNLFVSLSESFCQKPQVILTIKCSGVKKITVLVQQRTHGLEYLPDCSFEESTSINLFWGISALLSVTLSTFVLWQVFKKEYTCSMRCYSTPWKSQVVGLQTALTLSDELATRSWGRIISLYLWTGCLLLQVFLWCQATVQQPPSALIL